MEQILKLIPLVKPFYEENLDPSHDWPHIGRVVKTARHLAEGSKVNLQVLLAAVYCHDLVNLPKDHPERKNASTMAADKAKEFLSEAGFNDDDIKHIQQCVIEHSFSKGLKPTSLESAILQDSDRLDTLGAIGVLRCATVNTLMKASYYEPQDPLAQDRELNDKKYMVDHYFVKIFKLPEMMNTEEGRSIAFERVEYMKDFLSELIDEVR